MSLFVKNLIWVDYLKKGNKNNNTEAILIYRSRLYKLKYSECYTVHMDQVTQIQAYNGGACMRRKR